MANRVLQGQRGSDYGLWVSKPGQNVLTAPDNQLLFNSNFPAFGILEQGIHDIVWSFSGSATTLNYNQDAFFERTYPGEPFVWLDLVIGSYVTTFPQDSGNSLIIGVSYPPGTQTAADYRFKATIHNNRINFNGSARRKSGENYDFPTTRVRYTVFSAAFI